MIPTGFKAVTKRNPCPVCSKPDWCLIHVVGDYAICPRTEAGAIRLWGEAGYLHQVANGNGHGGSLSPMAQAFPQQTKWPELVRVFRGAATGELVARLAVSLGVTAVSLIALDIGLTADAWTFPMYGKPGMVCGIRYRAEDGRKWAVRGSRNGVFSPAKLHRDGPLLVCEGPTDTAAMLDLGYDAVGRASCLSNIEQMPTFAAGRDVVVVADGDGVGLRGAAKMAAALKPHCPSVCVIRPPEGIKDARAWKIAGATRPDLDRAIQEVRASSV